MTDKVDTKDPRWSRINSDLKNALDTWTSLTEQTSQKMSPEEEQLREIKRILGALKDKLQEFSDKPTK